MISSASISMSNRAPKALAMPRAARQPAVHAVEQSSRSRRATTRGGRDRRDAGSPIRPATSATSAARIVVIWLAAPKRANG